VAGGGGGGVAGGARAPGRGGRGGQPDAVHRRSGGSRSHLVVLVGRAGGGLGLGACGSGPASRAPPLPARAHALERQHRDVRMTVDRRLLAIPLALALGNMAMGCAGRGTAAAARSGRRILRVAYEREIDGLNPFTSQNLVDISFSMIEGLVTTAAQTRSVPVLATAPPAEDNGLIRHRPDGTVEMTWPLHEGVRWHDGAPFTSRDVCFTWRFVTSPGSLTYNREQYLGIKDCRTPDDHTVVFVWDGEYAYYAGLFEAILPEHVLGRMTTDEIVNYEPYNRGEATVGTGPFKFAEWQAG